MATEAQTVEFLTEQMAGAGSVRSLRMFGEYAIYVDDKVVALVCDDQLYVKITTGSRAFLDSSHDAPPYPGAKDYLCVPEDYWEQPEWLVRLIRTVADDLPLPKPKKSKRPKA